MSSRVHSPFSAGSLQQVTSDEGALANRHLCSWHSVNQFSRDLVRGQSPVRAATLLNHELAGLADRPQGASSADARSEFGPQDDEFGHTYVDDLDFSSNSADSASAASGASLSSSPCRAISARENPRVCAVRT